MLSVTSTWLAALLLLPAASVAITRSGWLPSGCRASVPLCGVMVPVSTDQTPPMAEVVYEAPARVRVMVQPASAIPLIRGVRSPVRAGLVI